MKQFISNLHVGSNVWLLTLAQSLIGCIGPTIVFVGGFIGLRLAPEPSLATLPIALMVVGIATFMWPAVRLIALLNRKKAFLIAVLWGVVNCWFSAFAIASENFWLFCLSIFLFGPTIASVQQFRFAAMESCQPKYAGRAVSILLFSGLIAAFLGPEIAFFSKDFHSIEFAGSFAALSCLLLLAIGFLLYFHNPLSEQKQEESTGRPLGEIAKQPIFILSLMSATVGFSVMSFIMTATPISMHVLNGFDLAQTKWVIQSHIIAMYLPSFFTGFLIERFGHQRILIAGIFALFLCLGVGFVGAQYLHFWSALVLLGIGWNFMFVTATTLLPRSYQAEEKLKVQGFNDSVMFTCQAIASLSAGAVINMLGWHWLLAVTIPPLLITLFYLFYWQSNLTEQQQKFATKTS